METRESIVFQGMVNISRHGERLAIGRDSSMYLTAFAMDQMTCCTFPIARIAGCSDLRPKVNTWMSGRILLDPVK